MSRVLLSSWKARRSPRQRPGAWPASRLASGRGRSEEPAAAGPPPARAALHLGEGGGGRGAAETARRGARTQPAAAGAAGGAARPGVGSRPPGLPPLSRASHVSRRLRSCCRTRRRPPLALCAGSDHPRRPEGLGGPRPGAGAGLARAASPPRALGSPASPGAVALQAGPRCQQDRPPPTQAPPSPAPGTRASTEDSDGKGSLESWWLLRGTPSRVPGRSARGRERRAGLGAQAGNRNWE